jgi:hypothetical protein
MGDELLSQFKVVSFDNLEEDDPPPSVQVDDTGQLLTFVLYILGIQFSCVWIYLHVSLEKLILSSIFLSANKI